MEFVELTEKEFQDFVDTQTNKNFFQTVMMKKKLECDHTKVYLVGVKESNKVIAASLIAETHQKFLGKTTFEAYKGFILDYHNRELLQFMTEKVKEFLKAKNGLKLVIDPYIPAVSRNMEAEITDDFDNRDIIEYLHTLGYKDSQSEQVKWTYCLDINGKSSQELFNGFRSSTRNNINKTLTKYDLNIRTLTKAELKEFKTITSDTCDRRSFADKSLKYYEEMFDCFKDKVTFKICEINLGNYIQKLENSNKEMASKLNELSDSNSNLKKKEVMKKDIENNNKKIKEAQNLIQEKGEIIPLSAAMFMLYGDEIIYLFSGSYAEYMQFCGQYRLQWEIIKYAADNNYKRYNFFGIQDVFNPNGKDRGVYEFKKGFGGYVEELLGAFELSLSPTNTLFNILKKIKHVIKKKGN
ncbi:MAG: peptidoglycan bridge formation glycyltransferase FemA/FemB family protein [bacterium]|nr:peptidoglycan bridge formation glycyltransferase FemA/FemB family protein [bacterium]